MSEDDALRLKGRLVPVRGPASLDEVLDKTVLGDALEVLKRLPSEIVDLLIVDPPYNLTKSFNGDRFSRMSLGDYERWLRSWLLLARAALKPTASLYICSEWRTSSLVHQVAEDLFIVRNRITWEREKGRGAQRNWKNCSEDIWYCTVSDDYWFDVEAVKMKRRVIAPYRDGEGNPKDWTSGQGGDFRVTHPSNLWTDITVPFWSMPENTDHPTQKPEKLFAKLLLASSRPGDLVLDPFLGSGTSSVVAKKLGRHYIGIEKDELYCLLTERRLELADRDASIQGYSGGYFWERNTLSEQNRDRRSSTPEDATDQQGTLFER